MSNSSQCKKKKNRKTECPQYEQFSHDYSDLSLVTSFSSIEHSSSTVMISFPQTHLGDLGRGIIVTHELSYTFNGIKSLIKNERNQ